MLNHKVAIVIGAGRGTDFEIAKEFTARRAAVIVCSKNMASAQESTNIVISKSYPKQLYVTDLRKCKNSCGALRTGMEEWNRYLDH